MGIKQPIVLKLLTGLSLLLLLGFLLLWNLDNYKRQKKELVVELTNQMELACAEYKDSVIQGIFDIVDLDATIRNLDTSDILFVPDERRIVHSKYEHTLQELSHFQPDSGIVNVLEKNFTQFETALDTSITILVDRNYSDRKIMVWNSDIQSTAVKIKYERDSVTGIDFSEGLNGDTSNMWIQEYDAFIPLLYIKIDTIFRERLMERNINLEHDIQTIDRDSTVGHIAIPFAYGGVFSEKVVYANFYNYSSYLMRRIMSPLLLSCGLFLTIAFSFFMLVKSWLNQVRLMEVKNEFISNMTHELKTPIATVGVALEALDQYGAMDDPLKKTEYIDISKHELNRLNILVDKVLKMSTLDQEFEELIMVEIDMRDLVSDVLGAMKLRIDKNDVKVVYLEEGSSFVIDGDKVHLTNVLYNLIDNAIKYSLDSPEIRFLLKENQNEISLSIIDNGIGISKEHHSKVFDRFFRVPNQDRHNVKGHGLGLHYVRAIIRKHKGAIKIGSVVPSGTEFNIVIPKEA